MKLLQLMAVGALCIGLSGNALFAMESKEDNKREVIQFIENVPNFIKQFGKDPNTVRDYINRRAQNIVDLQEEEDRYECIRTCVYQIIICDEKDKDSLRCFFGILIKLYEKNPNFVATQSDNTCISWKSHENVVPYVQYCNPKIMHYILARYKELLEKLVPVVGEEAARFVIKCLNHFRKNSPDVQVTKKTFDLNKNLLSKNQLNIDKVVKDVGLENDYFPEPEMHELGWYEVSVLFSSAFALPIALSLKTNWSKKLWHIPTLAAAALYNKWLFSKKYSLNVDKKDDKSQQEDTVKVITYDTNKVVITLCAAYCMSAGATELAKIVASKIPTAWIGATLHRLKKSVLR